jgi:uncharacterized protein YkwD
MKIYKLIILTILAVLPTLCFGQDTPTNDEQKFLQEVNKVRQSYGLHPFELSVDLLKKTRQHCGWMARNRSMTHSSYPHAENIAMGQRDIAAVLRSWLNSPGHRANLLGGYKYFAMSLERTTGGTPYWCQIFSDGQSNSSYSPNYHRERRR